MRPARPGDLGRIVEVEAACFSVPWTPHAFRSLLTREDVVFLVAETQTEAGDPLQVVGHGVLWQAMGEAELANLAVAPDHQGRGAAGALLDRLLEAARQMEVRTVFLEARESNKAALVLYRGRGFRRVGVRSQYYDRPREDAHILRLDLTKAQQAARDPESPAP